MIMAIRRGTTVLPIGWCTSIWVTLLAVPTVNFWSIRATHSTCAATQFKWMQPGRRAWTWPNWNTLPVHVSWLVGKGWLDGKWTTSFALFLGSKHQKRKVETRWMFFFWGGEGFLDSFPLGLTINRPWWAMGVYSDVDSLSLSLSLGV